MYSGADTFSVGITRDANGRPCLEDYETFGSLMDRSPEGDLLDKYPQLVSFVGQTSIYIVYVQIYSVLTTQQTAGKAL